MIKADPKVTKRLQMRLCRRIEQERETGYPANRVIITGQGCKCPRHGLQKGTEYKKQIAPCGCKWVWKNGFLISVP